MDISEMRTEVVKNSFFFEIKAFEVVVRKSTYCDGNTCHWELTSTLKISDVTKADFLQLNLSRIHGKIGK